MPSIISGDANVSATEFGYLDGVTSGLQSQIDSKLPLAGGKILQVVRATDATARSTTSTSFVDASLSVTITPQKSDSAIVLLYLASVRYRVVNTSEPGGFFTITDASNNAISGAELPGAGFSTSGFTFTGTHDHYWPLTFSAYATPATTSATTYKVRYRVFNASTTAHLRNADATGQLYAIEVSA